MKKQLQVWRLISKSLEEKVPVMLLYVVESYGSSPGRAGFFMAVNANGQMEGSIGGGIMEHKFVEMAKAKLLHNERVSSIYKQIHDKSSLKNQSGMICSGEQSNMLYKVKRADYDTISQIINCIENNGLGKLTFVKDKILFDKEIPEEDFYFSFRSEDDNDWRYEERVGYRNTLHIIGAGHCALALSRIMRIMDFCIYQYDNRHDLNTFRENEYVHKKLLLNNYEELKDLTLNNDYVVVMTMGYRTDDIVVRSLINKNFKYFGLLGSKKKIEKMFADYMKEGIDEALIRKIHAPIGLQINSQTPEEIAVSIAAEIIKVKNEAG